MSKNKDIETTIKENGNSFHFDVVKKLRSREWNVTISPYYSDIITNKAREIDIVAEKYFPIKEPVKGNIGYLLIRLFIECKYLKEETVFWVDKINKEKAEKLIIQKTPFRKKYDRDKIENHHYVAKDEVVKLFNTKTIYKSLNQSLHSFIYYRNNDPFTKRPKKVQILKTVNYPMIFLSSFQNAYKTDSDRKAKSVKKASCLLETNYAYSVEDDYKKQEYLLIDIVNFKKIDSFFNKNIKEEIQNMKEVILFHY